MVVNTYGRLESGCRTVVFSGRICSVDGQILGTDIRRFRGSARPIFQQLDHFLVTTFHGQLRKEEEERKCLVNFKSKSSAVKRVWAQLQFYFQSRSTATISSVRIRSTGQQQSGYAFVTFLCSC